MSHHLEFAVKHIYDSLEVGITIKATLRRNNLITTCDAKIDTGATFCLFASEFGEALDIDVESGHLQSLSTLSGGLTAYGHEIELETLGIKFQSFVYFAEDYAIKRNLLGRNGWLQLVRIALNDYDNEIYISPLNEDI